MIDLIIDQFSNLTPILWASQICGNLAFLVYCVACLLDKKKFLICSLFMFTFFLLEEIFASLYGGIITNVVSLIRSAIILIYLLKGKDQIPNYLNVIFIAVMWIGTILIYIFAKDSFANLLNAFLPTTLATIFTITQNAKNYMVSRIGMLVNEIGFFSYFFINNLPFSYLRELILVILILIGMIKNIIKNNKTKTQAALK